MVCVNGMPVALSAADGLPTYHMNMDWLLPRVVYTEIERECGVLVELWLGTVHDTHEALKLRGTLCLHLRRPDWTAAGQFVKGWINGRSSQNPAVLDVHAAGDAQG